MKIRVRERRGRPREGCCIYQVWIEYQVVSGRKIIARLDTREEAERFIAVQEEGQ